MMTNLTNDDDLSGGGGGGGGGNKGEHYANFNVLSNHTSFIDADNNNGSIQHRADCNLIAMQPFYYNNEPYLSGIARAVWIALAFKHLNEGNGLVFKEVEGLNERCNINFNLEFIDTQRNIGTAMTALVNRLPGDTNPSNTTRPDPAICGFIGAWQSIVTMSTSTLTNLRGYLQISGASTSTHLDNDSDFPLFARTIPSNEATAKAFVNYLKYQIGVNHLVVFHVDDGYGYDYFGQLLVYARIENLNVIDVSVHEDLSDVKAAIKAIDETQYTYIVALVYETMIYNDVLANEAFDQGLAGRNYSWYFFDFSTTYLEDRDFIRNSPEFNFYKNTGYFNAMAIPRRETPTYKAILEEIIIGASDIDSNNDVNNNRFDDTIESMLLPMLKSSINNTYEYDDDDIWEETIHRIQQNADADLFVYEAAIMLGISACNAASLVDDSGLYLNTTEFYHELVNTKIHSSLSSDVIELNNKTGTRIAETTNFAMFNLIEDKHEQGEQDEFYHYSNNNNNNNNVVVASRDVGDDENKNYKNKNETTIVRFTRQLTDRLYRNEWTTVQPYIYKNGNTIPLPDLPLPLHDPLYINTATQVVAAMLCISTVSLAIALTVWTIYNRKERIVRASQPFFLIMICCGVFIMAIGIIPTAIDIKVHIDAPDEMLYNMTIACTSRVWFWIIGFAIVFSALFGKAYRINKIMQHAKKFKRITVKVKDTLIPIVVVLLLNVVLLLLMTIFHPRKYILVIQTFDQFGRPERTDMQCEWNNYQMMYVIPLLVLDLVVLCLAVYQAYRSRSLSTEFQEAKYILQALVCIFLVCIVGMPVQIIVRGNQNAHLFVTSMLIFVSCWSILLNIFVPKIMYERKRKKKEAGDVGSVPLQPFDSTGNNEESSASSSGFGDKILSTDDRISLIRKNKELLCRSEVKEAEYEAKVSQFEAVHNEFTRQKIALEVENQTLRRELENYRTV